MTAHLVHEDDNPHDRYAVRVDIHGKTVGYLSRELALEFRKSIAELGHPGLTAKCNALIVGGWNRGDGDTGHFGVKLDLPTP
ncbi:MAG: HIRAN domain-containing protein [Gammaproteobacteria bacterium]|nr:HIRAN domain-containing protein [Gammaproteobacteria bacterium]